MRFVVVALLLASASAAPAAQPQFWDIEGASEFLGGDLHGLSVDAYGRVRLAPAAPVLHNPACPYVWTLTRDGAGAVYAGTGNDGQIIRTIGKTSTVFFDAPELEVHALAVARDGRLFVGSSPDGKVYVVGRDGEAKDFFDPEERYIWALAFDAKGNLLVATGAAGKVYRVDAAGKGTVILDGPETHIISLAVDASGRVFAGSSPSGIVYRIDTDGKVAVLQDTAYREIKAIALGPDGSVYVAALQGKEDSAPMAAPTPAPGGTSIGEPTVTVTESVISIVPPAPPASPGSRTTETTRPGQVKGAVLRILPSGEMDTLWSSTEEVPYALVRTAGGVLLGTGNKGKLYRIADDRTWTMLTTLPAEQITALNASADGKLIVATSNPGMLYDLGSAPSQEGTFESKVKDTDTASAWGRLRWHAEAPGSTSVRLATRSGNTSTPDATWSEWSALLTHEAGEKIASPNARFLQIRAVLTGKDGATPILDSIGAAYLQRNLRPVVTSITVHAPGEVFQKPISVTGDVDILGLDGPLDTNDRPGARAVPAVPPMTYSRKVYQKGLQTFSWKAEDANGDTLVYDIEYRSAHGTRYRTLRKGLTDPILVWDTSTVPNGRYVIRVVARDSSSNPEELALRGEKESTPFDVDNTPPVVTASLEASGRIHATARDDSSLIRKVEYSQDGGPWLEVYPVDGINDSQDETYDFTPRETKGDGPHVIVIRAMDLLGNASTARVEIP